MLGYVGLGADLGEEARLIRDTARRFVGEQVRPDIGEHFLDGTFPTDLIPEMGELGFYGPSLDGYGLPNVSERAYGLLIQELEAGDSGVRSMASVQGALVMYPIHRFGTEDQRERWLPELARGSAVGCFGLTEPEHGSDPSSMATRAERDGDGYRLTGSKTWITNAPIADVAVVWARDRSDPTTRYGASSSRRGATACGRRKSTRSSPSAPPSRARSASRTRGCPRGTSSTYGG